MCGNNVTTFISEIECIGRCHGQFTVAFSTGSVTNLLPFLWSSISYSWIFFSHWENRHNFNQISLTIFMCWEVIVCWLAFHERGSSVQIVARFYLTTKEKILFMPNRCACNSFIRPENNTSKLLNKIVKFCNCYSSNLKKMEIIFLVVETDILLSSYSCFRLCNVIVS